VPSLASVPKRSPYQLPSSTTLRVEAVYSLRVSMQRHESKVVRDMLKVLREAVVKQQYQAATGGGRPGYLLKLTGMVAEEVQKDEAPAYPDW
jgi:hypothetical protein